jgi:peptidoglycan/xylan/chitin deacetylase (PgdA/CDA1 family)
MGQRRLIVKGIIAAIVIFVMAASVAGTREVSGSQDGSDRVVEIPVLNYHMVDNLNISLSLAPTQFDEQMQYLHENGYQSITPEQLIDYLKYGRGLPDKPVLITFDDGYLDNYTKAYPILKKYGFTATIFLFTSLVGKDPRFMTWEEVREMQQDGFSFGSHTVNHLAITTLAPQQVMNELVESSREMERALGVRPKYFAYPTGAYTRQTAELVRQAGYEAAFTIRYGRAGAESDLYAIERIPIFRSSKTFRSFYYRLTAAPLLERLGIIRN